MKKLIAFLSSIVIGSSIICGVVGCGSNDNESKEPNIPNIIYSLTLSEHTLELDEGEQYLLTASVSPSTDDVIWSSSNINIVTVNNGKLTAMSNGSCTITATVSGSSAKDTCYVTVRQSEQHSKPVQPSSVILSKSEVTLEVEDTYLLNALVTPSDSDVQVKWTSTNESVVTVNNGLLTGISAGTAFIQATVEGGNTAVCTVEVREVYGSISGTITCRNIKTGANEVDVTTKIYLISFDAETVYLNSIMMSFDYNLPEKGVYQVPVDSAGSYSINNIKLGKYRMIIVCKGNNFSFSAANAVSASAKAAVLGEIYNKCSESEKESLGNIAYSAQMMGLDVTVGKSPLVITKNVYGVNTTVSVS